MRLAAVSADDASRCRAMQDEVGETVLCLTDRDAGATASLGIDDVDASVDHPIARPAVFVIDARGVVRYRYVSRSADDRPKAALLLLAAETLSESINR